MGGLRSAIEDHITVSSVDLSADELHDEAFELSRCIDMLSVRLAEVADQSRLRGVFKERGFLSVTAWLAYVADWEPQITRRLVATGKTLRLFAKTAARAADGSLSSSRLRILARAARKYPEEYRDAEEMLLGFAANLELRDLRRAVEYWSNAVDSLRAEDEAFDQVEAAYLHVSQTLDGMVKIDGLLDKESGEIVIAALNAAMTPEARQTGAGGEARPASKRRADALTDICQQFLASYPGIIGGQRPHITLFFDLPTLTGKHGKTCELSHTGTITPETARRIMCDAEVTPIIVNTQGEPLWLGRSVRTATAAQRKAVVARDRHCTWPGCDIPPEWCDIHHTTPFSDWGDTDIDGLTLRCRRHHILTHRNQPGPAPPGRPTRDCAGDAARRPGDGSDADSADTRTGCDCRAAVF